MEFRCSNPSLSLTNPKLIFSQTFKTLMPSREITHLRTISSADEELTPMSDMNGGSDGQKEVLLLLTSKINFFLSLVSAKNTDLRFPASSFSKKHSKVIPLCCREVVLASGLRTLL